MSKVEIKLTDLWIYGTIGLKISKINGESITGEIDINQIKELYRQLGVVIHEYETAKKYYEHRYQMELENVRREETEDD